MDGARGEERPRTSIAAALAGIVPGALPALSASGDRRHATLAHFAASSVESIATTAWRSGRLELRVQLRKPQRRVALTEIDPKTMASRIYPGILVGEMLDVDGRTAGSISMGVVERLRRRPPNCSGRTDSLPSVSDRLAAC